MPTKLFEAGNQLAAGTKRGPSRATNMMKTLVMDAAGDLGFDGKGRDGTRGWLRRQALDHPKDYLKLMGKMMPAYVMLEMKTQVNALIRHSTEREDYQSLDEAKRALEEDGITLDHFLPHLDAILPDGK
jgi:hypothetical protein